MDDSEAGMTYRWPDSTNPTYAGPQEALTALARGRVKDHQAAITLAFWKSQRR